MDPNAPRSRGRNDEADAYWRRRFFTLVAGLGILGLLAWATSGAVGGKPAHQSAASGPGGNGNASAAAYGSAAPGQPAGVAGTPSALPSAQGSVSLPASPSPSAPASGTASGTASPRAQPTRKNASAGQPAKANASAGQAGGACPARDIVLTLSVGQPAYARGAQPAFLIDIVSTDAAACAFDTGRKSLRIVITGGTRATWDSGACLRGATAHVEHLRRGVPSVASIVWDRRLRPAACTTPEVAAPPGQYQAMAVDGSVVSPAKAFRLR